MNLYSDRMILALSELDGTCFDRLKDNFTIVKVQFIELCAEYFKVRVFLSGDEICDANLNLWLVYNINIDPVDDCIFNLTEPVRITMHFSLSIAFILDNLQLFVII